MSVVGGFDLFLNVFDLYFKFLWVSMNSIVVIGRLEGDSVVLWEMWLVLLVYILNDGYIWKWMYGLVNNDEKMILWRDVKILGFVVYLFYEN